MLTRQQARRIAIRAAGLGAPRPSGRITLRHLRRVVATVGIVQLDSVNAVARAHELLFFSRLGPYDVGLLHELVYRRRELYEGWLHEACLLPTAWWPRLRWRQFRDRNAISPHRWSSAVDEVREIVRAAGPTVPSDIEHLRAGSGAWWGWSEAKRAMEALLLVGDVAVTTRRGAFERVYDLTERVLPADVLDAPALDEHDGRRWLLLEAARCLGIGTVKDLADYHRQMLTKVKPVVRELVAEGALVEHAVAGWTDPAYALPSLAVPRRGCPDGRLVSPFDPLVWHRARNERLFDFEYTIEIYTPAPKRRFGYYVLPFVQGDDIVARVDVRSDRRNGVLRVPGAFSEDGAVVDVAGLAAELRLLADWQGCDDIEVGEKGDLATALRRTVA